MKALIVVSAFAIAGGCISSETLSPTYEMSIIDGAGTIKCDGLSFGFGPQEDRFVIDCYEDGAWNDDLMLDLPTVHGAQPSMLIPGNCGRNEKRILQVRGKPFRVELDIKDVVSKAGKFTGGTVSIRLMRISPRVTHEKLSQEPVGVR